jgi:cell division septum initiation protein DivIVA
LIAYSENKTFGFWGVPGMTDDELRDFLTQILNVQRDLQAGQLKLQEGHVELQQRIAELTTNVNKLERIVQRHEG